LERDVEETLDRRVFAGLQDAELVIRGFIEENDAGETWVRLTARHRDGTLLGTRELRASGGGCAALRSDIVLVLTLLVEREQLASAAATAVRVGFGAAATVLLHVLPRWSAGAGPVLVVDIANTLQLRADLAYFLPVTVRTQTGIQAGLRAVSLSVRACQRLFATEGNPWSLHACAGLQTGAWLISQTEPARRELEVRLLVQALVDLRARLRLAKSVQLELAVGPSFSLSRTSLYASYENARDLLYRVPFLGAQLQLALVF
jgi:hypothetical protein